MISCGGHFGSSTEILLRKLAISHKREREREKTVCEKKMNSKFQFAYWNEKEDDEESWNISILFAGYDWEVFARVFSMRLWIFNKN